MPCVAAAYVVYFVLQISIFGEPSSWGSPMGWLVRVFDTDAALLMVICWAVVHRSLTPRQALTVGVGVFLWLILSILIGSRGGGLRIFLVYGMAAIAVYGNLSLTIRRFAGILLAAVAVSALIYPLGTVCASHRASPRTPWLKLRRIGFVSVPLKSTWKPCGHSGG